MADAPAVPPPASAATAVVASAITAPSRRRDRSGRLICSPIRRRAEQIMRAVDGAGYSDQAGSVWSGVTAVTDRLRPRRPRARRRRHLDVAVTPVHAGTGR